MLEDYFVKFFTNELAKLSIDIDSDDYKQTENYNIAKNKTYHVGLYGFMSLDKCIERLQLIHEGIFNVHENIGDGESEDGFYDDIGKYPGLALEIAFALDLLDAEKFMSKIEEEKKQLAEAHLSRKTATKTFYINLAEKNINDYPKNIKNIKYNATENASESLDRSLDNIKHRLAKDLCLNLDLFDKTSAEFNLEIQKIMYFIYMLEHRDFAMISDDLIKVKKANKIKDESVQEKDGKRKAREYFNALELFSNPSMENIDFSVIGMESYNGKIVKYIKDSLAEEMSAPVKDMMGNSLLMISLDWDGFIRDTVFTIELNGKDRDVFTSQISARLLQEVPKDIAALADVNEYKHSPIETMYLKVLQHESICHIEDLLKLSNIQTKTNYDAPVKLSEDVLSQFMKDVKIDDIEEYLNNNASKLAEIVFCGPEHSAMEVKEKNRAIKGKTGIETATLLRNWAKFCAQTRLIPGLMDSISELLILSCLQTFLVDVKQVSEKDGKKTKKENIKEFDDYIFYLSQIYMVHVPSDQAILSSGENKLHAKQIYWVHKVLDRLYANADMYNTRKKLRKYLVHCQKMIKQILKCPNVEQMLQMHEALITEQRKLVDKFLLLDRQACSLIFFQEHLKEKGVTFIDNNRYIITIFSCTPELSYVLHGLIGFIEASLIIQRSVIRLQFKETTNDKLPFEFHVVTDARETGEENEIIDDTVLMDFKFIFDYEKNTCTITDFTARDIDFAK